MSEYYKGSAECTECGRIVAVLVPTLPGNPKGLAQDEANELMARHMGNHKIDLSAAYPSGFQPCIKCSALIADRDIAGHLTWHLRAERKEHTNVRA